MTSGDDKNATACSHSNKSTFNSPGYSQRIQEVKDSGAVWQTSVKGYQGVRTTL